MLTSYDQLPTSESDPRVIGAPGKTTRWITLGPDSSWVVRAQFFVAQRGRRFGYDGWGAHVDVYRIDTIRTPRKRQGTYGAPLGQIGWQDGGIDIGRPGTPAPTVDEIIAAAERLIAEHGAPWEAAWLPHSTQTV